MRFESLRTLCRKLLMLCCGVFTLSLACPGQDLGNYSIGGFMFVGSTPVVSWHVFGGATAYESAPVGFGPNAVLNFTFTFPIVSLGCPPAPVSPCTDAYNLGGGVVLQNGSDVMVLSNIQVQSEYKTRSLYADVTYQGVTTPGVHLADNFEGHTTYNLLGWDLNLSF